MPTPTIKRPAFWCLIAPPDTDPATVTDDECDTVHVVINSSDQLRAELELSKLGLPSGGKGVPFHVTVLWLWAALARTGGIDYKFPEFKTRLLAYEPDTDRPAPHTGDPEDADELDAHPTVASTF